MLTYWLIFLICVVVIIIACIGLLHLYVWIRENASVEVKIDIGAIISIVFLANLFASMIYGKYKVVKVQSSGEEYSIEELQNANNE